MIRIIRRPLIPGEWNHELIGPLVFLASVIGGYGFFYLGLETPSCVFHRLTHLPCLGCGATRCARALSQLNFWEAFKFHPGLFLVFIIGLFWTIYSAYFWLRGGTLRWRFFLKQHSDNKVKLSIIIFASLHWAWQCYYLART